MRVRITTMAFIDGARLRPGAVVDLPDHLVPRSAVPVDREEPAPEAAGALRIRYIPGNRTWQVLRGDAVLDVHATKVEAQIALENRRAEASP